MGVDFLSMNDGIDTSTPAGRFTFHIIGAVAELERELIRERTKAGMEAAMKRGARIGRPRVEFDLGNANGAEGQRNEHQKNRHGPERQLGHDSQRDRRCPCRYTMMSDSRGDEA